MFIPQKKDLRFKKRIWLASPTMHGEELQYMTEAYETNWMSTIGENIDVLEDSICEKIGCKYAVALSCGTAALHLAMKLVGERLYGTYGAHRGALKDRYVAVSDVTFGATVNPILYEGGIPIFIDSEYETWNMDPAALEKAFEMYPEIKIVVVAHLYGTPAKVDELKAVCDRHGAVIVEDAAESLGATYKGKQTGCFGTFNAISFNGNKIITGTAGGMLMTDDLDCANKARKWATQSREEAPWYQHEELGYNYRMSNIVAGVARGQLPHLEEHIFQKKQIYDRYKEGLKGLPVKMNPFDEVNSVPNYWLSCILIDEEAMCKQVRSDFKSLYVPEHGKSCPTEIMDVLDDYNAQCRPIWKPMHAQPIYMNHAFITRYGNGRGRTNAYIESSAYGEDGLPLDVGQDLFHRGLCLPSDNKMTEQQQDVIIGIIRDCFE